MERAAQRRQHVERRKQASDPQPVTRVPEAQSSERSQDQPREEEEEEEIPNTASAYSSCPGDVCS